MKRYIKTLSSIIGVIIMIGIALFITDYIRCSSLKAPLFVIAGEDVKKDGGSGTYYGLGYTVKVEKELTAEDGVRIVDVKMTLFNGGNMDIAIIGGADGPTSIFLTESVNSVGWINFLGLTIMILLMIPNIIYALKNRNSHNQCTNKVMNLLEQVGRYSTMLLMVFNVGIYSVGFSSANAFIVYIGGNALLVVLYWMFWIIYFKRHRLMSAMILAIIPTLIFLLCGITLQHYLLVGFAILFGIAHGYVTYVNTVSTK